MKLSFQFFEIKNMIRRAIKKHKDRMLGHGDPERFHFLIAFLFQNIMDLFDQESAGIFDQFNHFLLRCDSMLSK